jgi:hypothetical protein
MFNRSLVLCVVFCRFLFVHLPFFISDIVLFVLIRFMLSGYPFGNFILLDVCMTACHFQMGVVVVVIVWQLDL